MPQRASLFNTLQNLLPNNVNIFRSQTLISLMQFNMLFFIWSDGVKGMASIKAVKSRDLPMIIDFIKAMVFLI